MTRNTSFHQKHTFRGMHTCPQCGGQMDNITDVHAHEGLGPRTYQYRVCQERNCRFKEFHPDDQRGYPLDIVPTSQGSGR